MAAKFDFDDRAFRKALTRAMRNLDGSADQVVQAVGEAVAARARERAARRTGRMADSIRSEPGRDAIGPYADVSVGPFYSSYVEWGTSEDPARPFFRPALEEARRPMRGLRY